MKEAWTLKVILAIDLNILQLTKDYQQDSITHKARIKRSLLTSEDHKNQEIALSISDAQWRNGFMLFAYALKRPE